MHVVPSACGVDVVAAVHVPTEPAALQVIELSVQGVLQQTPPTQEPLAQSLGCWQARPFARGVGVLDAVHVPTEPAAKQVIEGRQAVLQQTPSTQNPLAHWATFVQEAPFGCDVAVVLVVQVPAEPGALQVIEWPVQAVLQQTPPTQNPLKH